MYLIHGSRSHELDTNSLQNKHLGSASSSFNFWLEGLGSFALLKSSCGPHLSLVGYVCMQLCSFSQELFFVAPQDLALSVLLLFCLSFPCFFAKIRYGLLVKTGAPSLVLLVRDADLMSDEMETN